MPGDRDDHVGADAGVAWGVGLHATHGERVDAAAYGRYLGRWSRLFVPDLLTAATVAPGDRVLDLATGPGEAAVALVGLVGGHGLVVGADISTAMLEAASARLTTEQYRPVAADAQALPFPVDCFDAIVCQLGLMFFPNPADALAECWRTLRPGQRNAVCVISSPDRAPMWGVLADALSDHLPDLRELLHLSFALADPDHLARLFDDAGFHDVRVTPVNHHDVVGSFEEYWEPIETGTGQMPQAYLALADRARRAVRDEVHERLAAFEIDGRYHLSVEMLIASGQK